LCSSPPLLSSCCTEKNVAEAGVYLKMYTDESTIFAAVCLKTRT
jgi:hypothetical protein